MIQHGQALPAPCPAPYHGSADECWFYSVGHVVCMFDCDSEIVVAYQHEAGGTEDWHLVANMRGFCKPQSCAQSGHASVSLLSSHCSYSDSTISQSIF